MPVLMMATSHGDPVRIYPPRPGYFTLIDNEKHSWAQADVYALLHPLHAVSDRAGHYRIDGIPVGKLKVNPPPGGGVVTQQPSPGKWELNVPV